MRCVWPCRSAPETLGEPRDAAYGVLGGPRRYACATASSPAFAASFRHPRHPSRVPPRLTHWDKTVHMPPNTMPSSPHPRKSSPSTRSFLAFPRKSSPSTPENSVFWVFWACRANYFALAPTSAQAGRTFSRRSCSPHGEMKPSTPIRGPQRACVKPVTPLLTKIAPKTGVSASQWCRRFHRRQSTHQQRC